jgi:predicted component of type VI protein secretion system
MAVLIGMSGSIKGVRFEIDRDEMVIGRRHENSVSIDDASVSGSHCALIRDSRRYSIRDLKSTNGTLLNGSPVRGEARLKPKDIVRIGSVEVMFDGDDVEVESVNLTATTKIEVATGALSGVPDTFRSVSPFGARRQFRALWISLMVVAVALALGMLVVFFYKLFV